MKRKSIFCGYVVLLLVVSFVSIFQVKPVTAVAAAEEKYDVTTDWIDLEGTFFTGAAGWPSCPTGMATPQPSHGSKYSSKIAYPTPLNTEVTTTTVSTSGVPYTNKNVNDVPGLVAVLGGISLTRFTKLNDGVLQADGTKVYSAVATYELSVNIYTDGRIPDIFCGFRDMNVESRWFACYYFNNYIQRDRTDQHPDGGSWEIWDAEWTEKYWDLIRSSRFDGSIACKFGIDPIFPTVNLGIDQENSIDVLQDYRWGNIVVKDLDYGGPIENYVDRLAITRSTRVGDRPGLRLPVRRMMLPRVWKLLVYRLATSSSTSRYSQELSRVLVR
jgi:hypothetical protein